ncbi:MAG: protein kinase [Polyangiaceae bacterium]|nr:protein kinase [Polyangiaceae bacterium]
MAVSRSRPGDPAAPSSLGELEPGHVLDGRYRLLGRIGHGGFGDVWRAVELLHDGAPLREVALKILAPQFVDADWAEEAKLLASFSHPALVTIYAAGMLESLGAPFVAMELLIGQTLAEHLKRDGRLPWRVALRFARSISQALDVIHGRGVVHLDLKPANVFVTADGNVKVLDFGISRGGAGRKDTAPDPAPSAPQQSAMSTAVFLAESGDPFGPTQRAAEGSSTSERSSGKVVVGTPGFVAPEVLQKGEPTMLADAYALGVTLAVLATGRLPQQIEGEEPGDLAPAEHYHTYLIELRDATLRGQLRDLAAQGLPRGVVALVERLCAVDPARRQVTSGGLFAVVDEVWQRPHGAPASPYPGPAAFSPLHEGFLFGREQEQQRMLRHLSFEGALVIAGPSGSGKTSFVRASLVPELAKEPLDGRWDVRAVVVSAAEGPDRALQDALVGLGVGEPPAGGAEAFDALVAAFEPVDEGGASRVSALLVIDDFHAIVARDDKSRVVAFVERALSAGRRDGVRVVLVMDQEAVDDVVALSGGLEALPGMVRYLAPVSETAARDIAIEPARLAGLPVARADELARVVGAELSRGGSPLPNVALFLAACAREATRGASKAPAPRLDPASVLHQHADAAYERLADDAERALEILLCLTTSDGTPIRASVASIAERLGPPRLEPLVERLKRERLVRTRGDEIELGHPALAAWPRLASARLEAMDQIALEERIAEAALAWERAGYAAAYLAPPDLLAEIDRRGTRRGQTGLEQQLIAASRRRRWRLRAIQLAALVLALVVVSAGYVYKLRLDEQRQAALEKEREAQAEARRVGLVARARQSSDPYARAAYLVAAIKAGAAAPGLFVELLGATHNLPPGRFLSLAPLEDVRMPWDERWVVGRSPAGTLVVFDLWSKGGESDVFEHLDVDVDPANASTVFRRPARLELSFGEPIVETVALSYDTALLVLTADGALRVLRFDEYGRVSVAAVAPIDCRGEVAAAETAPVVACFSGDGIDLWDMDSGETSRVEEQAAFALSPDGAQLATWSGPEVVVHRAFSDAAPERAFLSEDVRLVSFSPQGEAAAVLTDAGLMVVDSSDPARTLFAAKAPEEAAAIVWDAGGLDVGVCQLGGEIEWTYLRLGVRPPSAPAARGRCDRASEHAPVAATSRFGLGRLAMRDVGEHFSRGAFGLTASRWLSPTLVLASATDDGLERVLTFAERDDAGARPPVGPEDGLARVVRVGDVVAVQRSITRKEHDEGAAPQLRLLYAKNGKRITSTAGHLLGGCGDGRILYFRPEDEQYDVRELRLNASVARVPRDPGFVVGASPSCRTLYVQRLDGTIVAHDLTGSRAEPRTVGTLTGYVFDVEPTSRAARGGPGLILAASNGEIVTIGESADELERVASAKPRASAIAEGPSGAQVLFADVTGVYIAAARTEPRQLLPPRVGAPWEDLLLTTDGRAVAAVSSAEIGVVDLDAGAVAATVPITGMTRLARWGDAGPVLAFAPDIDGVAHGMLIPFGAANIDAVGALASNLRVDEAGNLALKQ